MLIKSSRLTTFYSVPSQSMTSDSTASFWVAVGLLVLYAVVWTICLNGWRVA